MVVRAPYSQSYRSPLYVPTAKGGGGYSFADPDAAAYVAAMTVAPDDTRKAAIDAAFGRMKLRTYWAKLDWLSFGASHDAQASRVNAKNPTQIASVVGAPSFVADKGYTCGASDYIDLGRNLSTAGGSYAQNSAHAGVWNMTSLSASGAANYIEFNAAGRAQIWSNYTGRYYFVLNNATSSNILTPGSLGHRGWSRTGVNTTSVFIHGSVAATPTDASTLIPNGSVQMKSPRKVGAVHYGGGLTDMEWADLDEDIGVYFNESGIIPAFDVFLVIGDSNNHSGVAYDANIDLASANIWAHRDNTAINGGGEEPFKSVAPNWYLSTAVGYDVAFLRDFYIPGGKLGTGRKALIVKVSGGGTGLFTAGQEWRPTKPAYVNAVRQANEVLAAYPGAVLKGIFGIEGANDATASADPAQFEIQYDAMLSGFRTDILGAGAVPIVMGGIPPNYLPTGTATALQAKIASMPSRFAHAGYADPSLPTVINDNADTIHYSAQGQRGTLGNPGGMAGRFWTAYQAALADLT